MKENKSFGYEHNTQELKKSLSVGSACLGIVASRVWEANKKIIEYRVLDAVYSKRRIAHIQSLIHKA